jgi:hypothetical protein
MLIAVGRDLHAARRNLEWRMANLSSVIAAPAQFVSHVFRNVLRPSLFSVEGDSGAGKDRQESAAAFSCPILC